jgi:peptidoglycan/xylan/chitin deacetylase (PgdA/CDA1 family)
MRELVLSFHGLGEPHSLVDAREMRLWLSTASFARLLDQVLEFPVNAEPRILITFDDGNVSDALLALPELSKRGLFAEFFVCAGRIGREHYLDRPMIIELLAAGMSIGSHGMDHRDWRTLDPIILDAEISGARRKLEDLTQRPVNTVAIPFGSYNRRVLHRLEKESFKVIYTTDRGTAQRSLKIKPRETIDADMQGENVLKNLLARPPLHVITRRFLSRVYKRIR